MAILSIDQGTTSSRVIMYSDALEPLFDTLSQKAVEQIYPHQGWVEHDAEVIFQDLIILVRQSLDKYSSIHQSLSNTTIKSIGISNQRETTVLWDKTTGKPIHNAIVWQDRRTADFCLNLKSHNQNSHLEQSIINKTGLLIDPYFSASKINWLLHQYDLLDNPDILFGTIDSYIIWRLTNGRVHATDATNASRTQLYNINTLQWDPELLEVFNIPSNILPTVLNSIDNYGTTDKKYFGSEIPITGVAGDQQAAAIGQLCIAPQTCKITYGTGCFMLENTGSTPIYSNHKLITTIAYLINNKPSYAIEGSIFTAGATIQWLRDQLKFIEHAAESEDISKNLSNTNGVYFVPAFTGLGAPYWNPDARGAILGLTCDTGFEHIVRAGLESVCYQSNDLLKAFGQDFSLPKVIRVDGGMTANNWFLQFLANITRVNIERPVNIESTSLGVAILAFIGSEGINLDKGLEYAINNNCNYMISYNLERKFSPSVDQKISDELYQGWLAAVQKLV